VDAQQAALAHAPAARGPSPANAVLEHQSSPLSTVSKTTPLNAQDGLGGRHQSLRPPPLWKMARHGNLLNSSISS
jgi:hypothetical protein